MSAVAIDSARAPRRAQENLAECEMIFGLEVLRVGLKIGGKLLLGRLRDSQIFSEKFHFLPYTAANDHVVAVEARRSTLAVEHLVANVIIDEALQFFFARRALPRTDETVGQIGNPSRRNNYSCGRFSFLPVDKVKQAKQSRAEHEKLKQRLSQQRELQGVYQIGDV